jgi:ribosome-associated translation inhibitor RaiA
MQVQVNTNHTIDSREALEKWATAEVSGSLRRFNQDLTRVEVHLSDENPGAGADDKRCLMEARLTSHPPVAVSHHAAGIDDAFRGALAKLKHALDSQLGKLKDHRDRESIRRDPELGIVPSAGV